MSYGQEWLDDRRGCVDIYVRRATEAERDAREWLDEYCATDAARSLALSRVEWVVAVTALLAWVKWESK